MQKITGHRCPGHYTNAFVEGLNSVIRAIAQQGRGYDFEVLRGKVLLGVGRKRVYPKTDFGTMSLMTFDRLRVRDFGVPFTDIITKIDAGLFFSLIWTRPQNPCGAADNISNPVLDMTAIAV